MIQSSKSYYKAMNISSGLLLYYTGWVYGSPNVFQGYSTDVSLQTTSAKRRQAQEKHELFLDKFVKTRYWDMSLGLFWK